MLRHKLFHRAKKVPVSEQELKAKMKKKDKKSEKDEKKKKEEETAESSHAEGRETEEKKQGMVIFTEILIRSFILLILFAAMIP